MRKSWREAKHPGRKVFQTRPICLPIVISARKSRKSLRDPSVEGQTNRKKLECDAWIGDITTCWETNLLIRSAINVSSGRQRSLLDDFVGFSWTACTENSAVSYVLTNTMIIVFITITIIATTIIII